jgi:dolichol-phosphate mannosyltransferase
MSIAAGMISASLAVVGILYVLYLRLFTNEWVEGWAALILATLFIGGVQLICLGIVGGYVGRIYREIKHRPLYVVQEYFGFTENGPVLSRSPVVNRR